MKFNLLLAIALLLPLSLGELVCESNQVYALLKIFTKSHASEQSFKVLDDSLVIYTSPSLANNDNREFEVCLPTTTNHQYTLQLLDSYGDSWTSGSWLAVYGLYDNVVFKNYMSETFSESFPLSLYNGVKRDQTWRVTTGASEGWTMYGFGDTNWQQLVMPSSVTTLTGTQYFRYQFIGLANMASFEARFRYRYGIVAYVNGVEIYRDNMPAGVISSSTAASGSYSTLEPRGLLRSAYYVSAAQSVLAAEVHFLETTADNIISFNAFLAIYASSVQGHQCSVVPTSLSITTTSSSSSPNSAFDFGKTSYFSTSFSSTAIVLDYSFENYVRPVVNGFDIWPATSPLYQPKAFTFDGSHDDSSSAVYKTIIDVNGQIYESLTHKQSFAHFNLDHYRHYRLTITQVGSSYINLHEAMPLVCNIQPPSTITFESSSYSFYFHYQAVSISPSLTGFTMCSILPALPTGVILNPTTCIISGTSSIETPMTTYTLSSTSPFAISGTFTLATPPCVGTVFRFRRVYGTGASNEGFKVVDAANENELLTVTINSGQEANTDISSMICVTVNRIRVDFDDNTNFWSAGSYLYVNVMLDTERVLTLARVRKDNNLGLSLSSYFNSRLPIGSIQPWYYKMGEVPTGWSGSSTDSWAQATTGSFPVSTNKVQLYKKIITIDSLINVAGFTLALKYKYGCVVMINDVEVYRMGVDGAVSTAATATNVYSDVIYRTVTLPTKTMQIGETPSVTYLQQGTNTIAIALIALSDSQTTSVFDCVLSLMGENTMNRAYDVVATQTGSTNFAGAFDDLCSTYSSGTACADNTGTVVFNDDRREWISSVLIQTYYGSLIELPAAFIVEARNPEDETWTVMKTVSDLKWSLVGQTRRFWLNNNKPYNQWRLRNIGSGNPLACNWRINRIHLLSNSMTQDIPALTIANSMAFVNIELSEIYPSSDLYSDFRITPALPTGILMDLHTGMIFGTATVATGSVIYNVQATRAIGGSTSCTFNFSVEVCTGGRALMTVKMRIDSYISETSYALYRGRGIATEPIATSGVLPTANTIYYLDSCLSDGIYTFMAQDSHGDGWSDPAGYSMSLDLGELLYDINLVPSGSKPTRVTTVFSSYVPFQVMHTNDWKVYTSVETVAADWMTSAFNEADFKLTKAADIGTSEAVTVYIRKSFTVPNLDDYQVLNVRMKFTGGAVVYFNGNKVARFNMVSSFDDTTSGGPARSSSSFAKFHIILPTAGVVVNGNNVIAIELHRAESGSSTDPIVFDATGVFGVQDCSPVLDSFISLTSSDTLQSTVVESAFDKWAMTSLKLDNVDEGHITWEVENLEGSRFNNYGLMGEQVARLTFTMFARDLNAEEWLDISREAAKALVSRKQSTFDAPVGLVGFRQLSWRRTVAASRSFAITDFSINYCKTTGAVCPGIDEYPSVTEGQISPASCAYGYRGYSFRTCTGGVLGEIDNAKCVHKIPDNLRYSQSKLEFVRDTVVQTKAPTIDYLVTRFFVDDKSPLPQGLTIDPLTGVIEGIPTAEYNDTQLFIIRAENEVGSTFVELTIIVRVGVCLADGVFPRTPVGQTTTHECSSQGSYIGTQNRVCTLGKIDGEWQKASGICISIGTIVIIIVVVVIIVIIVVLIIIRTTSKTKAVAGVKGKKSVMSKTSTKKTVSAKGAKV